MIHFDIILEHIQPHLTGICIGLGGFICTLSMFMPRHWKIFKLISWMKKK